MAGGKHWTKEEKELLKELYGKTTLQELAKLFNRSEQAIQVKANLLGLHIDWANRPQYWNGFDTNEFEVLSHVERGYIAGILDGEGSIIYPSQSYTARIEISNTSVPLVSWLSNILNGRMTSRPPRIRQTKDSTFHGRKPCYIVSLYGRVRVYHLLTVLLPYLIVKRAQAEQVIEDIREKYKSWRQGCV